MNRRRFIDAPNAVRCKADCVLKDGSKAQCGRREAWDGLGLCGLIDQAMRS